MCSGIRCAGPVEIVDQLLGPRDVTGRPAEDFATRGGRAPACKYGTTLRRVSESTAYLLTDLAWCGKCTVPLEVELSDVGELCYLCLNDDCGQVWVDSETLESTVMVQVLSRLASAGIRAELAPTEAELAAVPEQIEDTNRRLAELDNAHADGKLDRREYLEVRREVYAAGEQLRQVAESPGQLRAGPATPQSLAKWWIATPLEGRREVLSMLLRRVDVHPDGRADENGVAAVHVTFDWR